MLNAKQISYTTRNTLKRMGIYEPSLEKLIKGTFLMQSNLENLYNDDDEYNRLRGLMLMPNDDAVETINEYIRYRPEDRKKVSDASGVDLKNISLEDALTLLETNIAFMVAVTAMFYSSHFIKVPDDNLESIASAYKAYFNEDVNVAVFIEKYTKTFRV